MISCLSNDRIRAIIYRFNPIIMPGTEEDFVRDEEASDLEGAGHVMTPAEAGFGDLRAVIAQSQGTHDQVAGTMQGIGDFPEEHEGNHDIEQD